LLTASQYRALISGRSRGLRASLARAALSIAAVPYSLATRARNLAFDRGWKKSHAVPAAVISVGNLTLGGTGKTPMVEWIARWLVDRGARVALVSRGYAASRGSANDEALELAQKLPGVPHFQSPDRVAAAAGALKQQAQVILLADGFQHRRLRRDVDIVLLDALDPWGAGRVFPRGLLREPACGLRRAHVVCLSRADLVTARERDHIRHRARQLAPHADWIEAAQMPLALRSADGIETELSSLAGRRAAAFCGIGNPEAFRRTLSTLPCDVAAFREFPDHHAYTQEDVQSLSAWAGEHRADVLLCTHKDLVKLSIDRIGDLPLRAIRIGIQIGSGQAALEDRLARAALTRDSKPALVGIGRRTA